MLAHENKYLDAAYEQLDEISQDKAKRLAYEARQKAILDYNTIVKEQFAEGKAEGKAEVAAIVKQMKEDGKSGDEIFEYIQALEK